MHKRRKVEVVESTEDNGNKQVHVGSLARYASHAIPDLLVYLDKDTTGIVHSYLHRHIEGTLTFYQAQDQNELRCFKWTSLQYMVNNYFPHFRFPYPIRYENNIDKPLNMDIIFTSPINTFAQDMERIMPRISEIYNKKIVCEFRFKYVDKTFVFSPASYHPPVPMHFTDEMQTLQPATLLNWLLRLAYHFGCYDVLPCVFEDLKLCPGYGQEQFVMVFEEEFVTVFESILKVFGVDWYPYSTDFIRPNRPVFSNNFFDLLRQAIQANYKNYKDIFEKSGFVLLSK